MFVQSCASSLRIALASLTLAGAHAAAQPVQDFKPAGAPTGAFGLCSTSIDDSLFLGTSHGVYRSDDQAGSWQHISKDFQPAPRTTDMLAIDSTLFVGSFSGLAISDDLGQTWEFSMGPVPGAPVVALAADSNLLYLVSSVGGQANGDLFVSDSKGQSWRPITTPETITSLMAKGDTIFVGAASGLGMYRSTDAGQSWTLLDSSRGLPFFAVLEPIIEHNGAIFVGSPAFAGGPGLVRSTDNGESWQAVATNLPVGERPIVHDLIVANEELVLSIGGQANTSSIFRSADNGDTWVPANAGLPPATYQTIPFTLASNGTTLVAGLTAFGAYRSPDNGASWFESNTGLDSTVVFKMTATEKTVLANAIDTAQVWREPTSPLEPWSFVNVDTSPHGNPRILSLSTSASGRALAGTQTDGIYISDNDGASWTARNTGVPVYNGSAGLQFREIEAFAHADDAIVAGTGFGLEFINGNFVSTGGGILRSTDGGNTWTASNTGFPIRGFNSSFEPLWNPVLAAAANDNTVLVGTASIGIYRSTNAGQSWAKANTGIPTGPGGAPAFVSAIAYHDGSFYAGTLDEGLLRSDDDGVTWTRVTGLVPLTGSRPIVDLSSSETQLLAAVGWRAPGSASPKDGVYSSNDSGQTWERLGTSLDGVSVLSVASRNGNVYAGTAGLGLWILESNCYADCDQSTGAGVLDIFDFLCFQNRFVGADPYACDCDTSTGAGVCDIFDFLCFQGAFVAGCP